MRQLAAGLVLAAAMAMAMAMTAPASAQNAVSAPDMPPNPREWVRPAPRSEGAARPERMRPHRRHAHARRLHPGWRSPADHAANRRTGSSCSAARPIIAERPRRVTL